ncbi:MAG TPA: VOC family protein [Xanthobacteraceae bacterium]|nr:VOC family protein [Xanthobacteraceae bacterium]
MDVSARLDSGVRPMSRGLDHVVHAVHDLDGAADVYTRLGFTVGARNRHPWGTHNRIVQLAGSFIEILTVAEPDKLGTEGVSLQFGARNRDFLARHEGLSFLMLESGDAPRDAAAFRAAGIGVSEALTFTRTGQGPDGGPVKVGFSLAFAQDPRAPEIGFAVCRQLQPESFWNPVLQAHPNTAVRLAGVVLVADNPSDHHVFLSAFAGQRDLQATSSGITLKTSRGDIQVMDRAAFLAHFGAHPPDTTRGARLAALRFAVRDLAAARSAIQQGRLDPQERMGRIVVGPRAAMGATLAFEEGRRNAR